MRIVVPSRCFQHKAPDDIARDFVRKQIFDPGLFEFPCCIESIPDLIAWKELPYEAVLGQMVTIREDGIERRVSAAEAFLLHMAKQGLEGDGAAARAAMGAIEQARATNGPNTEELNVEITFVQPGSVNTGLQDLRMAEISTGSDRPRE